MATNGRNGDEQDAGGGAPAATLSLVWYTPDQHEERQLNSADEAKSYLERGGVTWLHVTGLGDQETVQKVGEAFGLHPLIIEDVVSAHQRSKAEEFDDHDFVVVHGIRPTENHDIAFYQLSIIVSKGFLLSFQRDPGGAYQEAVERLRLSSTALRHHGVDHLLYVLLDATVDAYFPVLEEFGEYLEFVEDELIIRQPAHALPAIQAAKHQLMKVRRAIWPLRETVNVLLRDDNDTVTAPVRHYLRDCYDHVVSLMDTVETYREISSDLMDVYMSTVSNRLNAVMKVLTVISTIFLPLTFIVGLYGMNFRTDVSPWNMPELTAYYGYPATLLFMVLVAVGMLLYFRKAGWLGGDDGLPNDRDAGRSDAISRAAARWRSAWLIRHGRGGRRPTPPR